MLPPFVIGILTSTFLRDFLIDILNCTGLARPEPFSTCDISGNGLSMGFTTRFFVCGFDFAYRYGNVSSDGLVANHWVWGVALYTSCIATALGKAALTINIWNKYTVIAIPGSFLLWLGIFPAYATVAPLIKVSKEYHGILSHVYPSAMFWATIIILPIMCLIRDFAWKYYRRMYRPETYHYVQEIQKYNIADYRPRMEQFQKTIRKVRQFQRSRRQRGFAFSQADEGQTKIIEAYDTSKAKGKYGEKQSLHPHNTIRLRQSKR